MLQELATQWILRVYFLSDEMKKWSFWGSRKKKATIKVASNSFQTCLRQVLFVVDKFITNGAFENNPKC